MAASKRPAADPTASSNENKKTCTGGEWITAISDEQGLRSELGEEVATNMSKSVVLLTLSEGDKVLFSSSGVAIERRWNATKFVTAASLVEPIQQGHSNVKIEVHYEGKVVIGVLEECNMAHGIAIVKAMAFLDVYCIPLHHVVELMPQIKAVSVARDISGKLMATSTYLECSYGYVNGEACGYHNMLSACIILSETWQGGAAFDSDGNFVGMNLLLDIGSNIERAIIVPKSRILELWQHLRKSPQRNKGRTKGVKLYSCPQAYADVPKAQSENGSRGYPPSTSRDRINRSIALLNAHHGPYGDVYPDEGVWGEFSTSFSLFLSKNVVALASFDEGRKFFSCTGFFINFDDECQTILTSATLVRDPDGSNKIFEGLKIRVLLPNNRSKEGKLIHCSLQYNVALVSVKNCRYVQHMDLEQCSSPYSYKEVVAVGRSYESGALMATRGDPKCWSGPFACRHLCYSTCKISKAGIGGPLVDIDGKFYGMNYYDKKMGTPYLYFDVLLGILQYFKTKQTEYRSVAGKACHILEDNNSEIGWILPDPSSMDEREREEERRALSSLHPTSSGRIQYGYVDGSVIVLK